MLSPSLLFIRVHSRPFAVAFLSFLWLLACDAFADPPFHVTVDCSKAPECQAFAEKSKALVEEWYPRINDILFEKSHALPTAEITLIFERMKGVAHTENHRIHISAEWVTKKSPNDYGMVIHELTHIVQDYNGKGDWWLTEGIADYMRDRYFEPGVRHHRINPDTASYKQGYGTAATFLLWLEKNKNKEIVRRLNIASHDGSYRPELFAELCGANLDALWKEFADTQRRP